MRNFGAMNLKNSKFTPVLIFVAGFLWDVFTLNRIDNPVDNLILGSYLLMAGVSLVVSHGLSMRKIQHAWLQKYPIIWNYAVQFFLGGLFSSYVVYYFRSTTISSTLFFIILMIVLLLANEFLPRRLGNVYLQTALFTIASFSYFIYLIPVLIKKMGTIIFLGSGLVSLLFVMMLIAMLVRMTHEETEFSRRKLWFASGSVYVGILLLYFMNLIPPIPLAAKHIGAYVGYERTDSGYRVQETDMGFMNKIRFWEESVPHENGKPVFVFASVFAPTGMEFSIVHHWQQYDEQTETWKSVDRINYRAIGGRDGGYRGVSRKTALVAGLWRVDIEDDRGFVVARLRMQLTNERPQELYWVDY
jgi:hypothetical protein